MKAQRPLLAQQYIKEGKMPDPNHSYSLNDAVTFVAECQDMCPEFEREEREFTNFLEPFEKIPGTDRVDHAKAVKRYKRTLDYLLHDIINQHGVVASHAFVRDRARSIRNDLTLQNYRGVEAVILHERIARYHIMCSNVLCGSPGFVMQQEVEQLRKTLLSLMEYYKEMNQKQIRMPNEAEFQAYYILTLPWSNDVPSRLEQELQPHVFMDFQVQLAFKVRFLLARREDPRKPSVDGSLNHYSRIFSIIRKRTTPYLFACCIHIHFLTLRAVGLRAMQRSYHYLEKDPASGMNLSDFIEALGFDGASDSAAFLEHYFVDVAAVGGAMVAYTGRKIVTDITGKSKPGDFPKYPYTLIPDSFRESKSELIESKRAGMSHIDILDGKFVSLPAGAFSANVPSSNGMSLDAHPPAPRFPVPGGAAPAAPNFSFKKVISGTDTSASWKPAMPTFSFAEAAQPPAFPAMSATTVQQNHTIPIFWPEGPRDTIARTSSPDVRHRKRLAPSANPPSLLPTPVEHNPLMRPLRSASPLPKSLPLIALPSQEQRPSLLDAFEDVKDDIYLDLITPEIHRSAAELLHSERAAALSRAAHLEVLDSLLSDVIRDLAMERIMITQQLKVWRLVLDEIAVELMHQTAVEELHGVVWPIVQEWKQMRQLQRFVLDRWGYFVLQRKYARKRDALIGKRMVSYLRQSILVPEKTEDRLDILVAPSGDMIEHRLASVAREMAEQRATWYERILLERDILPLLSTAISAHYKITVATSNGADKVSGSLRWFADTWLKAKLSHEPSTLPDGLVCLRDESFAYEKTASTRILLTHCDAATLPHHQQQKVSSWAAYDSTMPTRCFPELVPRFSNAIFTLATTTTRRKGGPEATDRSHYWSELDRLLRGFSSNMPLHSCPPLLLLASALPWLFDSKSPFSAVETAFLKVSAELFDSGLASSTLLEKLIWLFEHSVPEPALETDVICYIERDTKKYEWAIWKAHELIPENLYHIPAIQSHAANLMVELYNAFLRRVCDIITDDVHLSMAFPAREFASYPLDWNTPESFSHVAEVTFQSLLPPFPDLDTTIPNLATVLSMYVGFVEKLYALPGAVSETLDGLKSCIISASNSFSCAEIFFALANATLGFYANAVSLSYRPFSALLVAGTRASPFLQTAQLLMNRYIDPQGLLVKLVEQSEAAQKKRKANEEAHESKNGAAGALNAKRPSSQSPMELAQQRLKQTLRDAEQLLQSRR
ncbi:hypothetical protein HDV03_000864 [Kappamyces sp. JEL0829]|nr:hypothetical protein HDV03_000864 [Kappamyces sp. JEL0829]